MTYLLSHTILNGAEKHPSKAAFRYGKQTLTYVTLAQRMNQLSNLLIELGVKRGDRVGVFLNRCLDTATAIYGIMNTGAVYVPIDPNAPATRIQFLIDNCDIKCLVSNDMQRNKLQKLQEKGIVPEVIIGTTLDSHKRSISWEEVETMPTTNPNINILERDLAYILFTSGSTGKPKGIMHSHYSGLSYAKLTTELYQLRADDIFGNHAPIFFDISTLGYFTAPFVGGTTVIASDAHCMMPASLSSLIAQEKISVWYSVPLALIQMLQKGAIEQRDWSHLRWMLYAGESFPVKHLRALMHQIPQAKVSNIYGPTETNQCTYYNLDQIPSSDQPIPIGKVWRNTEMLILDEKEQEVAKGEIGELLIRSASMMEGYWRNPARTAKSLYRIVGDSGLSRTFYRTGDLVRADEQNQLHFLGRKDRQIKTRGFRVELDEVEIAILAHESVNEAAVWAKQLNDETIAICAVVTSKNELNKTELKNYLKQKLPVYALPQQLELLKDLPRTPTGKIDRNKLNEIIE